MILPKTLLAVPFAMGVVPILVAWTLDYRDRFWVCTVAGMVAFSALMMLAVVEIWI